MLNYILMCGCLSPPVEAKEYLDQLYLQTLEHLLNNWCLLNEQVSECVCSVFPVKILTSASSRGCHAPAMLETPQKPPHHISAKTVSTLISFP